MKSLITIILFSISFTSFATDTAQIICGKNFTTVKLVDDWEHSKKKGGYCAKAECSPSITREHCFVRKEHETGENMVRIILQDHYREVNKSGVRTYGNHAVVIGKDDACFKACSPEKAGGKSGLEKKSCVECFKTRSFADYDGSINYPEIGKKLEKGTKCYFLCVDKPGPFKSERILPKECQTCVGVNGFVAESFEYLQTRHGQCFEVDQDNKRKEVDKRLCKEASQLLLTEYDSSQTPYQFIFNKPGDCYEVDSKTGGLIYQAARSPSLCESLNINNSDRNAEIDKVNSLKKKKSAFGTSIQ